MTRPVLVLLVLSLLASAPGRAADSEEGFVPLFDGKTLSGWKTSTENPGSWHVEEGAIVARGPRSHLFYEIGDRPFRDFELKVEVMTEPGSNAGIYFHTRYQEQDWPREGFESQVNVSHSDWKRTGSLYDVVNLGTTPARDNVWWTQHITVKGQTVTVRINDQVVLQYTEPPGAQPSQPFTRKLAEGTFALQAHDPKSVVRFRNIRAKRLD